MSWSGHGRARRSDLQLPRARTFLSHEAEAVHVDKADRTALPMVEQVNTTDKGNENMMAACLLNV